MKKINFALLMAAIFIAALSINLSCDKLDASPCTGKGTLTLTNKSLTTVQRIMINGVNYGSLDPGNKKSIELTPGTYDWQLVGLSGGTGCSAAKVNIVACEDQGYSCSGK